MIVIGIGSNSRATAEDVLAAIRAAESRAGVRCDLVAALMRGAPDAAIAQAAKEHGRPAMLLTKTDLAARSEDCLTISEASLAAYGVASVAEAAALAGAGRGSRLLVPRLLRERVTAAVAASEDSAS